LLFKGFDQFVPGLIVAVLKALPIFILMIPYYIFVFAVMATRMPRGGSPSPDGSRQFMFFFFGAETVFFLMIMVVSILLEIFFIFAFPLVAERKMSGLDAVKLSFKAAKANFGGVVGLVLLNGLFSIVGLLCCIVGLYSYLPVSLAAQAVAYRRVFPDIAADFTPPPPPPGSWGA